MHEAGIPEPWCQTFIPESNDLAERLATDPRVAFLSFIGSARVGWSLHHKLAPGTRSALEHGGVAPAIVDWSANLARIIEPLVKGGYYHAGQVCVSTQRIFVHAAAQAEFLERFTARVRALKVGDPLEPEAEVGPSIHPREAERVSRGSRKLSRRRNAACRRGATVRNDAQPDGSARPAPRGLGCRGRRSSGQ